MVWVAPKRRSVGEMETAVGLNEQRRDDLIVLGAHSHDGSDGEGSDELSGIDKVAMDDVGVAATAGLLRRNGTALTWGATGYIITAVDQAAGTASLRTLGTGATQAAAGDHGHL